MTMPTSVATFRDSAFIQGFHYLLTVTMCYSVPEGMEICNSIWLIPAI